MNKGGEKKSVNVLSSIIVRFEIDNATNSSFFSSNCKKNLTRNSSQVREYNTKQYGESVTRSF